MTLVRAEDKMYLYVDSLNATVTKVPKMKAITKLEIGGSPSDSFDCFQSHVMNFSKLNYLILFISTSVFNVSFNLFRNRTTSRVVSKTFSSTQVRFILTVGLWSALMFHPASAIFKLEASFRWEAMPFIVS